MMKKIVELLINIDNIDWEGEVDTMSLVERPAIGVDWLAFAEENFVEPTEGQTQEEYMGVCVPTLMAEGYDQDQAVAICSASWEDYNTVGLSDEEQKAFILSIIDEYGEEYNLEEDLLVDMTKQEFSTLQDIAKAVAVLDILGKTGVKKDQPAEQRFRYAGPSGGNSRDFCRKMVSLNKLYTLDEIRAMESRLSLFGATRRKQPYSVLQFKGGAQCRHSWNSVFIFRQDNGRIAMLDQGPVSAETVLPQIARKMSAAELQNAGQIASPQNNYWRQNFTVVSEDKQIVVGPAMIPQKLILRKDEEGNPFYVFFSKETIAKISEKFLSKGYLHNTDVNHDMNVTQNNTLLETWIVEDPENDKSKMYGYDVPQGTWMVSYRINDTDTWNLVKQGKLNGYSIAGVFAEKLSKS